MKLIYIKWVDACSNSGWYNKKEMEEWFRNTDWTIEEVGWIAVENKDYIGLVSRKSAIGNFGMLQKIPKPWILEKKIIKL